MMYFCRNSIANRLIWFLIAWALMLSSGCSSRQTAPQGPPVDQDLERFNRAARTAFENGRIQQAAELYQQALERAYIRDDLAEIIDARYNLAVCLMILQSYEQALEVVYQAREESSRAGRRISPDILLLQATILYRRGKPQDAWQITEEILTAPTETSSVVQSKTHFLRGLIAGDRGDIAKLREEMAALGRPTSPMLRADYEELQGALAVAERNWDAAVLAFDEAAALRRENVDYRGMVKALAKAGDACERAGRSVAASRRYLRAGQSAALQGDSRHAQIWLTRAEQLAEQGGDQNIAQEARLQLAQLQKDQPSSRREYDPTGNGLR